ncbi:MAG: hypothetical protein O7C73_00235 [Nitrospirae bacterium]|nr:hypothetical protein [Nitrospirota bacterium]
MRHLKSCRNPARVTRKNRKSVNKALKMYTAVKCKPLTLKRMEQLLREATEQAA